MMENLQMLSESTTKLSQIVPTQGIETGALNRVKYVGNTHVFCFGFNFL